MVKGFSDNSEPIINFKTAKRHKKKKKNVISKILKKTIWGGKKCPEIHKKEYYLLNTRERGKREKNTMNSKNKLRGLREYVNTHCGV